MVSELFHNQKNLGEFSFEIREVGNIPRQTIFLPAWADEECPILMVALRRYYNVIVGAKIPGYIEPIPTVKAKKNYNDRSYLKNKKGRSRW